MFTKSCVHLSKFIVPSAVALSKWQKMNQMMRMSKKELGDWHEDKNENKEPKCSRYPVKSGKISEYKREEQQLAKQRKAVLRNDRTILTLLTSSSMYALLLIVCLTLQKAHATPTNSAHVGSKVIEMCARHTLRVHTPSINVI